jgi:hypothetical protein
MNGIPYIFRWIAAARQGAVGPADAAVLDWIAAEFDLAYAALD